MTVSDGGCYYVDDVAATGCPRGPAAADPRVARGGDRTSRRGGRARRPGQIGSDGAETRRARYRSSRGSTCVAAWIVANAAGRSGGERRCGEESEKRFRAGRSRASMDERCRMNTGRVDKYMKVGSRRSSSRESSSRRVVESSRLILVVSSRPSHTCRLVFVSYSRAAAASTRRLVGARTVSSRASLFSRGAQTSTPAPRRVPRRA